MKHKSSIHLLTGLACLTFSIATHAASKPNIIFILADDMGVGDVSHTTGKAATPNLDRLAKEGMRFTDAHTSSSVCSPTRYGIMTGRYNWRSWLKSSVILSPDKRGPMITPDRITVPSFLKENGYHTALVGKWHMGLGWSYLVQARVPENMGKYKKPGKGWDLDYTQKVKGGPTSLGFNQSFFIAGSLDMAPSLFAKESGSYASARDLGGGLNLVQAKHQKIFLQFSSMIW